MQLEVAVEDCVTLLDVVPEFLDDVEFVGDHLQILDGSLGLVPESEGVREFLEVF